MVFRPIYRVDVKPESVMFKNAKPWDQLKPCGIDETLGISLAVYWQTNKSSTSLAFTCCVLTDLGHTLESLFEGHRVSVTGALELNKADTHCMS
jgi:hypothetical protein